MSKNTQPEIYVSLDIESNGPNPGMNSMLSLGAAAFLRNDLECKSTFSINFQPLANSSADPKTMEFWSKNQAAYDATRENQIHPMQAIPMFNAWAKQTAKQFNARPVAVCYPVSFDWMFVSYYMARYTIEPFTHACIDLKSIAFAKLGKAYKGSGKKAWPKEWQVEGKHTHVAVDDAIEQGQQFIKVMS
jgi:DNA polymerase III epsilon subunit-like protein